MSDKRNIATYTLAASLFCLAAAFTYFTIGLTRLANQTPVILNSIEQTSKKIEPVLAEFYKVRELIPPIVTEVTEIRKQIPKILKEVKQVRKLVPPILQEVKLTREAIPPILIEVKKVREAAPTMLTKADELINNAKNIGQKSSEGAVSGFLTGIIKAPFKLIGDAGKSLFTHEERKNFTEKDRQLSVDTSIRILSSKNVGEIGKWSNPDSGNNGVITLKETKMIENRQCGTLNFTVNIEGLEPVTEIITACLNDKNEWEIIGNQE